MTHSALQGWRDRALGLVNLSLTLFQGIAAMGVALISGQGTVSNVLVFSFAYALFAFAIQPFFKEISHLTGVQVFVMTLIGAVVLGAGIWLIPIEGVGVGV